MGAALPAAVIFSSLIAAVGQLTLPLHRQRVPVKGDDGTVSFKSVYFGTIAVGAPDPQEFSVVFDTGSGHVIIPGKNCKSASCQIHRRYDRRASKNAVDVDFDGTVVLPGSPRDQVTVAFGTGEVTGQFVRDRLCLGMDSAQRHEQGHLETSGALVNASSTPEAKGCTELRIVVATEMSDEPFEGFAFDGVLGLGLDSLALAPEFSLFGVLAQQLPEKVFAVFLAAGEQEQSEICFGGHDPQHAASAISWASVLDPALGYWQVQIIAIHVGDEELDFCKDGQCRAVVDTGTSLLAMPSLMAEELQRRLQDSLEDPTAGTRQEDGSVDCRRASGAMLRFELAGGELSLAPGDYARPAMSLEDFESEHAESEVQTEGLCRPSLLGIDLPEPLGPKLFILGEPVLRKYYSIYDWGLKRVGFALANGPEPEQEGLDEPSRTPLLL